MHDATVLQVCTFCSGLTLPSDYTPPTNLPCLGSAGAAVGVVSAWGVVADVGIAKAVHFHLSPKTFTWK